MIDAQAQLLSTTHTHNNLLSSLLNNYIAMLNENHIEYAVLLQPFIWRTDNQVLLDALNKYPKRLRGFVIVEPDISLEELQTLQQQSVVGVRIQIDDQHTVNWQAPAYQQLLANLESLQMHISLNQSVKNGLNKSLQYLLNRDIQVIVEALGQPDILEGIHGLAFQSMLATCLDSKNIWFNVSGYYQTNLSHQANIEISITFVMALMKALGSNRLLWGSDWPFVNYQDQSSFKHSMLWFTKHMPVTEAQLQAMSHDNAIHLYCPQPHS